MIDYNKVYIVFSSYPYEGSTVEKIFRLRKDAEEFLKFAQRESPEYDFYIQEMEIN